MSTPPALSGPATAPASGGPARQLVILLHGVGVDGDDLISLAPILGQALPDAAFVAPHAPEPCDFAPTGRQWFSLGDRNPVTREAGVRAAAPLLDRFIDRELATRGLADDALALVGFSQGTMMALFVAPRRAAPCAGVVGFSGALVAPDRLAAEIKVRPRTLLVHGDCDEILDPAYLGQAENALAAVGIPVLAELRPGLGHGIDGPGLALAATFLRQAFGLDKV